MDDDYDDYCDVTPPSRPFQRTDILVIALNLVGSLAQAVVENAVIAQNIVIAHGNHQVDRNTFHEQAALEIETLTNGDS